MTPSPGRIVEYTLTQQDADGINRRRHHARASDAASGESGVVIHAGNDAHAGEKYPLIIVRVWGTGDDESPCNGQVMLDGNDTLWVTSVHQGDSERTFREFARVSA